MGRLYSPNKQQLTTPCLTERPSSRRSLTKSTTQPGIALWAGTSGLTSRTRPGISSTSNSGRWPFCCSRVDNPYKDFPPLSQCYFVNMVQFEHVAAAFNLGHSWLGYHQPKIPVFILNLISKHLTILVILVVHLPAQSCTRHSNHFSKLCQVVTPLARTLLDSNLCCNNFHSCTE